MLVFRHSDRLSHIGSQNEAGFFPALCFLCSTESRRSACLAEPLSRYRLRQQHAYGRAAASALQWWSIGYTEAPSKVRRKDRRNRPKSRYKSGVAKATLR